MRLLPRSLRSYRRYWALFFLALFLFLLWVADYGRMHGWQVPLFLEFDPLTALAGFLTSGTLYKGLALALCIIVPTLFLGRFFCSWVCPLGITSQILGRLFNRRKPADEQHLNAYRPLFRIKYYLLMALLVLAALGSLQIGLLDPIALIYRSFTVGVLPGLDRIGLPVHLHAPVFQGGVLVALLFAAILVANRFMPRFWCRVLCPLGALLGVLSRRAPLRIQRDIDKCTDCGKCVRHCQGACDPDRELRIAECHLCMNCIEDCPEDALHFGLRRARSSAFLSGVVFLPATLIRPFPALFLGHIGPRQSLLESMGMVVLVVVLGIPALISVRAWVKGPHSIHPWSPWGCACRWRRGSRPLPRWRLPRPRDSAPGTRGDPRVFVRFAEVGQGCAGPTRWR